MSVPAAADTDAGSPWVYEEPPILPGHCGTYPATGPDFVLVGCGVGTGSALTMGVYEFRHTNDRWRYLDPPLSPSGGPPAENFGARTAVDGDTAIVGAAAPVTGGLGAAYVFVRRGSKWTEQQKITSPDETPEDSFGSNVAISKDTVVVSARTKTVGANVNQGAVYVFVRSGTSWSFQQRLEDPRGLARDFYGERIAVGGDTILVSDQGRSGSDVGKVNVYTRSGATWTHTDDLVAPDPTRYSNFGKNFLLSGDTVLVSAPAGSGSSGAVYPFQRTAGKWTEGTPILAIGFDTSASFGDAMGLSGDSLLISAPDSFQNFVNEDGLVVAYRRSGAAWTEERQFVLPTSQGGLFGVFLAFVGKSAIFFDNDLALRRGSDSTGSGGAGGAMGQGGGAGLGSAGTPGGAAGATAAAGACNACACGSGTGPTCAAGNGAGSGAPSGCGCRITASRPSLSSLVLAAMAVAGALARRPRRTC